MREHKYRAWDKFGKNGMSGIFTLTNVSNLIRKNIEHFIIMEYIGRKDINNKDIYEGDIFIFEAFSPHHDELRKGIVEWDRKEAKFLIKDIDEENLYYSFCELSCSSIHEIIGNKFENLELLEIK